MLRGLYSSASGLQAETLRQETLADNLANVNTSGYKAGRTNFKSYQEQVISNLSNDNEVGTLARGVALYQTNFDMRQGPLRSTGAPLDIAISGQGFIPVQSPDGNIAYTRNGHFNLDPNGYMVTQHGDLVLDAGFAPVFLGTEGIRDVTVLRNGQLSVNGDYVTRLGAYAFPKNAPILKLAGDRFKPGNEAITLERETKSIFQQGFIEGSNINSVKASTELIQIMRSFEANQKILRTQSDTLDSLIDMGRI